MPNVPQFCPMSTISAYCSQYLPNVVRGQISDFFRYVFFILQILQTQRMCQNLFSHFLIKHSFKPTIKYYTKSPNALFNFFQVQVGVNTLCKYLDNIMQNPTEEKFRKIRQSNKAYQERVSSLEGTDLFLQAAGFLNTTDEGSCCVTP